MCVGLTGLDEEGVLHGAFPVGDTVPLHLVETLLVCCQFKLHWLLHKDHHDLRAHRDVRFLVEMHHSIDIVCGEELDECYYAVFVDHGVVHHFILLMQIIQ